MIDVIDKRVNVIKLCEYIMNDIINNNKNICRYCAKMRAIEMTCKYNEDNVVNNFKPIIENYFKSDIPTIQYRVEIEKRNNNSVNKITLINKIVELIPNIHKVNIKEPDSVIIVEIFKGNCGISIIPNWTKYKEYNLRCNFPKNEIIKENTSLKRKADDTLSDWRCVKCNKPNFATKTECFNCGTKK